MNNMNIIKSHNKKIPSNEKSEAEQTRPSYASEKV